MTGLNAKQLAAATTLSGDVIVDAGAGSGKTRAMTERFVNATNPDVNIDGWSPAGIEAVVAITFTEKAAGELAERIRLAFHAAGQPELARRIDSAWISTIHGFCSRILREHAVFAGLDPAFVVADEVFAGQLSELAFDQACRALVGSNADVETLLSEYGYEETRSNVLRLSGELTKKAAEISQVDLEAAPDIRALALEAALYFEEACGALGACGDSGKKVGQRTDECRDAATTIRALLQDELSDSDLALALWEASSGIGSGASGTKASGDLLPATAAKAVEIRESAAAFLLRPLTEALVALTDGYRQAYERLKRDAGALDFDDLQLLAARVLANEEIAKAYRDDFALVMVDEFQDTDDLQLGVVSRVCRDNLFTVGDERQSIYRFRGADVDVYRRHRKAAIERGIEPIEFTANYRSHNDVIAFVNSVFGSDDYFGTELIRLSAERAETQPRLPEETARVRLLVADKPGASEQIPRAEEARAVAEEFDALRQQGFSASEMVVLVRSWLHASEYAAALRAQGFEVMVGGGAFFALPEVALCRLIIRAASNPHDEEALVAMLASPLVGMTAEGLWMLTRRSADAKGRGVWESMHDDNGLSTQDADRVRRVCAALERARTAQVGTPLSTVLLELLEGLDYDLVLFSEETQGMQELANILKLMKMADSYEAAGGAGLAGLVTYLDTRERLAGKEAAATLADDSSEAVRIMTVHGAKGLEFPVVAVVGLGSDRDRTSAAFQSGWNGDSLEIALKLKLGDQKEGSPRFEKLRERQREAEAAEALRLLYVAATRAKEVLILSGVVRHTKFAEDSGPLANIAHTLGIREVVPGPALAHVAINSGDSTSETLTVSVAGIAVDSERSAASESLVRYSDEQPELRRPLARSTATDVCYEPPSPLSHSALALYRQCPHRFWAERVLRVGTLEHTATDGAGPLGFGSAVHAALQLGVEQGNSVSEERLEAIGKHFGLDADQQQELATSVETLLRSELHERVQRWGRPMAETPFSITVGSGPDAFLLAGAMDVVALREGKAWIVDYKTGTSDGSAAQPEHYAAQARCYALAAIKAGASEATVTIVRPQVIVNGQPQEITLGPYGPNAADEIEAELVAVRRAMLDGHYAPAPSADSCRECGIAKTLCAETYGRSVR